MNLLKVAEHIQHGLAEWYSLVPLMPEGAAKGEVERNKHVLGFGLRKTKGHENPDTIIQLIQLETSVPDEHGMTLL